MKILGGALIAAALIAAISVPPAQAQAPANLPAVAASLPHEWHWPPWANLDPLKDAEATTEQLSNGSLTVQRNPGGIAIFSLNGKTIRDIALGDGLFRPFTSADRFDLSDRFGIPITTVASGAP